MYEQIQRFVFSLVPHLKPWFVSVDSAYGQGMARNEVSSGGTLTIPEGYNLVITGDFTIGGDLIVDGDMAII